MKSVTRLGAILRVSQVTYVGRNRFDKIMHGIAFREKVYGTNYGDIWISIGLELLKLASVKVRDVFTQYCFPPQGLRDICAETQIPESFIGTVWAAYSRLWKSDVLSEYRIAFQPADKGREDAADAEETLMEQVSVHSACD